MIETLCEQQIVKQLISSSGGNAGHAVATAGAKIGLPVGMANTIIRLPSHSLARCVCSSDNQADDD